MWLKDNSYYSKKIRTEKMKKIFTNIEEKELLDAMELVKKFPIKSKLSFPKPIIYKKIN